MLLYAVTLGWRILSYTPAGAASVCHPEDCHQKEA